MKRALVLNAVNPAIGGVLIRGERGTAKSTAVRALGEVLPDQAVVADCPYGCPPDDTARMCAECHRRHAAGDSFAVKTRKVRVIDLPLDATEDRLTGTLNVERALGEGETRFDPGLLAAANRNILYVDEVNLLDDHLVDSLLDAAAMGENIVEREGISHRHPSEFILVGTMNPEEGSLRPQLLDRFGLVVDVTGINDVEERVEISNRQAAFESDPEAFCAAYESNQRALARRIAEARRRLNHVTSPIRITRMISEIAVDGGVPGLRGDIAVRQTAAAAAAIDGDDAIGDRHVEEALALALAHRRATTRRNDDNDDAVLLPDEVDPGEAADTTDGDPDSDGRIPVTSGRNNLITDTESTYPVDRTEMEMSKDRTVRDDYGRRIPSMVEYRKGRYVGSQRGDDVDDIAVDATLRAAALRQAAAGDTAGVDIQPEDFRGKLREHTAEGLLVLVVDASGSVMNGSQMRETKRAVLSLIEDAYRTRDRVAVVAFRGRDAEVSVPPTRNVGRARRRVSDLHVGGNTPLCHGLVTAYELVDRERRKDDSLYPIVVVFSDGKVNIPYKDGADPEEEVLQIAAEFASADIESIYVDTGHGLNDSKYSLWSDTKALAAKRADYEWNRTLADAMDGAYLPMIDLPDGDYVRQ
jgi:magnesium chelatase subunit D